MTRRCPSRPTRVLAALPGAPLFVTGSFHGPEEGDLAMLIGLAAIGVAAVALTIVVVGARRLASRGSQDPEPEPTDRRRQRLRREEDIDPIVAALGVGAGDSARRRRRPPPFDEDRPPSWPAT